MSSVLCEKQEAAADKKSDVAAETDKKHEKRGIYGEGYGNYGGHDFGGHDFGGHDFGGHEIEQDHHHVHHHHEKTIVNVKKVLQSFHF